MKFKLLGTRGSRPILTKDQVRFGGNTTAFKISIDGMSPIYVDGGTGIFREGVELVNGKSGPFEAHFLITHTHWDHILAFPFFAPLFQEGTKITIMGPRSEKYDIKSLFEHQHNKGLIPIPFSIFKDKIEFKELYPNEEFNIGHALIKTVELNHQGLTLGYRIEHGGKSLCIITDHAPIENNHLGVLMKGWKKEDFIGKERKFYESLIHFVSGTDLMMHDTHFTAKSIKGKENWGHSSPEMAVDLAARGGVKKVVLGHHAPEDTDHDVDMKIKSANEHAKSTKADVEVIALREGEEIWV